MDMAHEIDTAEIAKSLYVLKGIIMGITLVKDNKDRDIRELTEWSKTYVHMKNMHPVCEILPFIDRISLDERLTRDELDTLEWFIDQMNETASIPENIREQHRFIGYLHGITSDASINETELAFLENWFVTHESIVIGEPLKRIRKETRILAETGIETGQSALLIAISEYLSDVQ